MPLFKLHLVKLWQSSRLRKHNRRMRRTKRLNDYPPIWHKPTSPPRNLSYQGKGTFCRSKVGHLQTCVGKSYPDKLHSRKVQPLRNHLRPQKNIDFLLAKSFKRFLQRSRRSDAIRVDAGNRTLRQKPPYFRLDKFRPETRIPRFKRAALRALFWRCSLPPTIVTLHHAVFFVPSHRNRAILAHQLKPARIANIKMRKAPPIQKHNRLLLFRLCRFHFVN